MKKQSVLLLSPFFYPEQISTGKYNAHLAEELIVMGHEVKVLASHPLYPSWRPQISNATMPGVEIVRGGSWVRYPRSVMLRRAVLELWYLLFILRNFTKVRHGVDYVVPIFPPSLCFFVLSLFLPNKCRAIGIVHDLQGVYAKRSNGLFSRVISKVIHYVEKRCFSSCDKLLFLSRSMAEKATSEYHLNQSKCVVCYPFTALSDYDLGTNIALDGYFDSGKTSVVYSGGLGDKQNPDGLLAFLHDLSSNFSDEVECHIFSSGPHFNRLRSIFNEGEFLIKFHDLVPEEDLNELYARSDVQIIPQAFGTSDGSLPSKLPNLMAAGVPVFVICDKDSELAELVLDAGAGYVSNTWNPEQLVGQLLGLLVDIKGEDRDLRRKRLQEFVKSNFSVRNVVNQLFDTC